MDKRLVILVDSFDKYQDLWEPFFYIFNLNWNDCPFDIKLVTNNKDCEFAQTIKTGEEVSWAYRTLKAVESLNYDYILLLLEDYFIGEKVNNKSFIQYFEEFIDNDGNYMRLTNIPKSRFDTESEIYNIYSDEEYGVNLQAAIWKKSFLIQALKECHGTAWEFEINFLSKTQDCKHEILNGCFGMKKDPLQIKNGVLKGKWYPPTLKYFKKKNIIINKKNRKSLSKYQTIKYQITFYIKNNISYKTRKRLKKILKKLGFKFISDL